MEQHENLGEAIKDDKNSPLRYGSEFCPYAILQSGIYYPLSNLSTVIRAKYVKDCLSF